METFAPGVNGVRPEGAMIDWGRLNELRERQSGQRIWAEVVAVFLEEADEVRAVFPPAVDQPDGGGSSLPQGQRAETLAEGFRRSVPGRRKARRCRLMPIRSIWPALPTCMRCRRPPSLARWPRATRPDASDQEFGKRLIMGDVAIGEVAAVHPTQ